MAELKYEKYIIKGQPTMLGPRDGPPRQGGFDARVERPKLHPLMALTPRMIEGASIVICQWIFAGEEPGMQGAHTHPYDGRFERNPGRSYFLNHALYNPHAVGEGDRQYCNAHS